MGGSGQRTGPRSGAGAGPRTRRRSDPGRDLHRGDDDGRLGRHDDELHAPEQAAEPASAPAATVPAGWYADPSGRFELRYWDGSQWTEHVARGGQQYTDPPVA